MLVFGILRLGSLLMDCSSIAPLTTVVIVIRGVIFQPLFHIVLISGSYFACFCVRACSGHFTHEPLHLHGIDKIMFHGHLDYCQKPLLEGRPNTKSGDYGIPKNAHNR
jgi:hypothetical protein